MKLRLVGYADRGVPNKERLHLQVVADTNLSFFLLLDTYQTGLGTVSSIPRHAYWFASTAVKAGDQVVLYTGPGINTSDRRLDGSTVYFFYWGQASTFWNGPNDCAVVMEVAEWITALPS